LSTEAPLAYVIPSKWRRTASVSTMSAEMGWVDGSWSWAAAAALVPAANRTHASVKRVADAWACDAM
jgi:hypothetical protein